MTTYPTNSQIPSHLRSACTDDYCAIAGCPETAKQDVVTGRWFITIGHAGFNSPANNNAGYATKWNAVATSRRYATRAK